VAKGLKRKYLGFEIVPEYFEFAKERLEKGIYRISAPEEKGTSDLPLFGDLR
jgi:DNA modification methylase